MGIYLGCSKALVSQQLLDAVELRTVVEHHAGKGVTQHVRTQLTCPPGLHQAIVDDMIDKRRIHGSALGGDQEIATLGLDAVAQVTVAVDPLSQLGAEGHKAVFVTLAVHLELTLEGVNGRVLQADEFAQSDRRA